MIEIEYKFQLENPPETRKLLEKTGYTLVKERTFETSVMYDNPQGLMQTTDGRIRVRKSGEDVEFCYKKPLTREGIKQEIEHEVRVSDLESLKAILAAMEFHETTSYERYRTDFHKDGVKATIDEYPFAAFLELEGEIVLITKAAQVLGFDLSENLTDSCDTLFRIWRVERGLAPVAHMKFES